MTSPAPAGYPVPARRHRTEISVRGSRFIATVAGAADPAEARDFVEGIRSEFPDATHHCWAWVVGPPGDTARVAMSDDGEPHGTAGRPMLDALLHSGVGDVAAVVARYFGGTKLGRGGLARAYAGAVQEALGSLPTKRRLDREPVVIEVGYPAVDPLLRFLDEIEATREDERFGERVRLTVALPVGRFAELERRVAELTAGGGRVRRAGPDAGVEPDPRSG